LLTQKGIASIFTNSLNTLHHLSPIYHLSVDGNMKVRRFGGAFHERITKLKSQNTNPEGKTSFPYLPRYIPKELLRLLEFVIWAFKEEE
jgi:hypothetical protein